MRYFSIWTVYFSSPLSENPPSPLSMYVKRHILDVGGDEVEQLGADAPDAGGDDAGEEAVVSGVPDHGGLVVVLDVAVDLVVVVRRLAVAVIPADVVVIAVIAAVVMVIVVVVVLQQGVVVVLAAVAVVGVVVVAAAADVFVVVVRGVSGPLGETEGHGCGQGGGGVRMRRRGGGGGGRQKGSLDPGSQDGFVRSEEIEQILLACIFLALLFCPKLTFPNLMQKNIALSKI